MNFWLLDPKTNERSVSLSLLVLGVVFSLVKILLSNTVIGSVHFGEFTGAEFTAVVSPLALLYFGRKNSDNKLNKESDK